MKVKTWLPVFPGFYGTSFDYDNEFYSELEWLEDEKRLRYGNGGNKYIDLTKFDRDTLANLLSDCFEWDRYKNDVGEQCCSMLEGECPFIKKITYESMSSPREYNFTNDSINCTIELDKRAFRKWIYEHTKELDQYFYDNLTSRSGFISFHPNNFLKWEEMTNKFRVFEKPYYVGAILDCYFQVEEFDSWKLRESLELYEGEFIDYEKVAEKLLEIMGEWEENEEEIIIYRDPNQLDMFENKIAEETNER